MTKQIWEAVEGYLNDTLISADLAQQTTLKNNVAAGLPTIDVAPHEGKLLYLLAKMRSAKRILEIGTLGGYSTIWLARALPEGGTLTTLELDLKHAEVAKANIAAADLAAKVEIRTGPALDSLSNLHAEKAEPFDFVFIDADKSGYPAYLDWSLRLSKLGTVIVADNVVREGAIVEADSKDPSVQGVRQYLKNIARNRNLDATAIQTVGTKGYDGFALAVVVS